MDRLNAQRIGFAGRCAGGKRLLLGFFAPMLLVWQWQEGNDRGQAKYNQKDQPNQKNDADDARNFSPCHIF